MSVTLLLICQASSHANRATAFGLDEPLDAFGLRKLAVSALKFTSEAVCYCSPATQAAQTAEALGLSAQIETLLRAHNYGRWAGLSLEAVFAQEPNEVSQWLTDPKAAPHGGESVTDVIVRAKAWLAKLQSAKGKVICVTDSSFIRAAIVCALGAPPLAFWRIDIAPLSLTRLSGDSGRWNLQGLSALQNPSALIGDPGVS